MLNLKSSQKSVLISIVLILIITTLEFPAPIGFETRPQDNVSLYWLAYFLIILISEIATIPLIYKRPKIGAVIGIFAGILNVLFVIADLAHLLQPEVATLGYSLLEIAGAIASISLVYFSQKVYVNS